MPWRWQETWPSSPISTPGPSACSTSRTLKIVKTIEVGGYPEGIEADPAGRTVYVACWDADTLERIDTTTLEVTGRAAVGNGPRAFGQFLR